MGPMCIGMARRALDMMCEHASQRATFGVKLADRQAVQWWIADAATSIHACRLSSPATIALRGFQGAPNHCRVLRSQQR
jgi:alkylation response protein AidB-like acyl-CoA dehydrogenase